jgi:TonB family protein
MSTRRPVVAVGIFCTVLLAACSPKPAPERPVPPAPAPAAEPVPEPRLIPPLTMDGYKKAFAAQVARDSKETYVEPIPEVVKSIVVLEVAIDRDGKLRNVSVRRSNGFKALENRALENVRRAAPYAPPPFTLRRSDGSVVFLESFLFRDDGRFRILSLVN